MTIQEKLDLLKIAECKTSSQIQEIIKNYTRLYDLIRYDNLAPFKKEKIDDKKEEDSKLKIEKDSEPEKKESTVETGMQKLQKAISKIKPDVDPLITKWEQKIVTEKILSDAINEKLKEVEEEFKPIINKLESSYHNCDDLLDKKARKIIAKSEKINSGKDSEESENIIIGKPINNFCDFIGTEKPYRKFEGIFEERFENSPEGKISNKIVKNAKIAGLMDKKAKEYLDSISDKIRHNNVFSSTESRIVMNALADIGKIFSEVSKEEYIKDSPFKETTTESTSGLSGQESSSEPLGTINDSCCENCGCNSSNE